MEHKTAVTALSALGHAGRLEVFRLLVKAGVEGMAAGEIARATGSLPNTLSANLNILSGAGLVQSRREGRSIIYTADYARMGQLLAFLVEDCCAGKPEICGVVTEIAARSACGADAGSC
ncbi:metalloregulator ArsR/SmtB family transcription factor [Caulobacter sp. 17J65-9]|uniref:ArsR/SmtB family transcription factor n=1 Tax=Caulobacter sp. 17J65-9 TaxID=2709382 RepID=UPI0013CAC3E8|nr:metalloregulator ArsR/SmtB family transcription factor [Caulobacter sp. 17J65-9]NEX91260.1 helix-turn-helix transcriptional regulator [Caulobacter sp. 17J65-9]